MKSPLVCALLAVCVVAGCGKPSLSEMDRQVRARDAKIILEGMQHIIKTAEVQRAKPIPPEARDSVREMMQSADDVRNKFRGTKIEPEATRLCLSLTTYFEMLQKDAGDCEAAATNVTTAKESLQAVAKAPVE